MKPISLAFAAAVIGGSSVPPDSSVDPVTGPRPSIRELPSNKPNDCADRIERVREELQQPRLDRRPASAERPYLIAAVDKRIDGCAVMQMKGNVSDLRPLPEAPDAAPRIQPAR